jgi:hypothetical protein
MPTDNSKPTPGEDPAGKFQNSTAASASSDSLQNLKLSVHEDWTRFRTVDGLTQKAGVSRDKLSRLVMKELTDNALDAGAIARVGALPEGG